MEGALGGEAGEEGSEGKGRGGGVRVCSAHACERQRRRRRGSLGDDSGFARWGNGRRLLQGLRHRRGCGIH